MRIKCTVLAVEQQQPDGTFAAAVCVTCGRCGNEEVGETVAGCLRKMAKTCPERGRNVYSSPPAILPKKVPARDE